MSDIFNTITLGIIEGITEFLPISSTGHLLIAEKWLGERSDVFNVTIQAGAILAIVLIYWERLVKLFTQLGDPANRDYFAKLTVSFLITAVGGFLITAVGHFKLPEDVTPVAWALVIGGLWILVIEWYVKGRPETAQVTWSVAIWVGLCQILAAVFPGTSRSAATIFAAMLAGLTLRPAATEFAFLVGIPTMFAATGYELVKAMHAAKAEGHPVSEDWAAVAIGFVVSGIVAFIAVKWLLRYVQSHRFTLFALYRIIVGGALLGMSYAGFVH